MKKSLIALAVLGSFAGAASAANTVTLWGKVDTAYQAGKVKTTTGGVIGGVSVPATSTSGSSKVRMSNDPESRIGIKVSEDLGNGLSAFVRLEGAMTSDVGTDVGFGRESVIGLKGNFGSVYFGRSVNPVDNITIGVGNRMGDMGGTIVGDARWSNSAFYAYENHGLSVYAAVSTKGGAVGNNVPAVKIPPTPESGENAPGTKTSYALSAKYAGEINNKMGYTVAAGYSRNAVVGLKSEWLVNGTFSYSPVTTGLSYSQHRMYAPAGTSDKGYKYRAFVAADVTSNDKVYLQYTGGKDTKKVASVTAATTKTSTWGLGYSHSLSKRTAVFADIGRETTKGTVYLGGGGYLTRKVRTTGYNIGMRHSF